MASKQAPNRQGKLRAKVALLLSKQPPLRRAPPTTPPLVSIPHPPLPPFPHPSQSITTQTDQLPFLSFLASLFSPFVILSPLFLLQRQRHARRIRQRDEHTEPNGAMVDGHRQWREAVSRPFVLLFSSSPRLKEPGVSGSARPCGCSAAGADAFTWHWVCRGVGLCFGHWIRLEVSEDTKIPNAATFKVVKQDHTLANMLRGFASSHIPLLSLHHYLLPPLQNPIKL
jgi:hypothetical protein